MNFLNDLKSIPSLTVLFEVFGWDAPPQLGGKRIMIGELQTHSAIVTSKWGDENLFIRHQKLDEDLKLKPQWTPYSASYKLGGKCPYEKMLQELNLY